MYSTVKSGALKSKGCTSILEMSYVNERANLWVRHGLTADRMHACFLFGDAGFYCLLSTNPVSKQTVPDCRTVFHACSHPLATFMTFLCQQKLEIAK